MRFLLLLLSFNLYAADVKIGNLPLGTGSATTSLDSFPFVNNASAVTQRLLLSDLINIPSLATPVFTGTVTAPTFVGAVTGNVTGTASGNTKYTANQYGVVLSGSGTTMSVLAPDASTTKVLVSGGAGANPSWALVPAASVAAGTQYQALVMGASASGWGAVNLAQAAAVTGVLPVANGGTGQSVASTNYNFIVNGAFDYWQPGITATVTATGGGTPAATYLYQADQWYVNNVLGGGTVEGIITFSRSAGVTSGSIYGAQVQITTAPTGTGIQNGTELYTVLSNISSLPLYGQTASFTALVKALNNVNQVGCQFFYSTSASKPTVAIGSEQTVTVNSSTFTACSIDGQALGTAQGAAGVIGVRIRITGVSSGNLYSVNNGFVVEQAMLTAGSTHQSFVRQNQNPAVELTACQYFYEKSYDVATTPGTSVGNGGDGVFSVRETGVTLTSGSYALSATPQFKVSKRTVPTMTIYSTDGTSAKVRDLVNAANDTPSAVQTGTSSFAILFTQGTNSTSYNFEFEWVADARI